MKATFTGVPGEKHESVYMYGQNFPLNQAVEVTDPQAIRKLRNHPHFKAELSAEDRKIAEQVKREFAAAATAGLMEAQADAIRRDQATATPEAPPAPPPEITPPPLKSALEYQEREMGGGAVPQLSTEQLREQLAAREEQEQQAKESTDGNAKRAGDKDSAKDQGRRAAADAERGRTGKGS